MIGELAQDLYDRVSSIAAISTASGLTVGGKDADPGMTKIPLPAAWVLNAEGIGTLPNTDGVVKQITTSEQRFIVLLYIPYTSQSDLIQNQFPLVQTVISTVHGKDSPSGERWKYRGHKLSQINTDRMAYRIEFSVNTGML